MPLAAPLSSTASSPTEPLTHWVQPKDDGPPRHAHFDCFSGAAGDMILAAALDAAGSTSLQQQKNNNNNNSSQTLLQHVTLCLRRGLPELDGEFSISQRRVWKGSGQIAANYVQVDSIYQHRAAPVPTRNNDNSKPSSSKQQQQQPRTTTTTSQKNPELDNAQHKPPPLPTSSSTTINSPPRRSRRTADGKPLSSSQVRSFSESQESLLKSLSNLEDHLEDDGSTISGTTMATSIDTTTATAAAAATMTRNKKATSNNNKKSKKPPSSDLMEILNQSLTLQNNGNLVQLEADSPTVTTVASTVVSQQPPPTPTPNGHDHHHDHHHHDPPEAHSHSHNHATTTAASPSSSDSLPLPQQPQHTHEHSHGHSHGHNHGHSHHHQQGQQSNGPLRNLPQIRAMLEQAPKDYISTWVRDTAIATFTALAHAEAHVHGAESIEHVHFHEVGAVDSIVDTVGSLLALEALNVTSFSCSRLPLGEGTVRTDHGLLPVPAPATLQLLMGLPTTPGPPGMTGELVTPTAAALLRTLTMTSTNNNKKKSNSTGTAGVHRPPPFTLRQVGIGAGTKEFEGHPNVLRILIGTL